MKRKQLFHYHVKLYIILFVGTLILRNISTTSAQFGIPNTYKNVTSMGVRWKGPLRGFAINGTLTGDFGVASNPCTGDIIYVWSTSSGFYSVTVSDPVETNMRGDEGTRVVEGVPLDYNNRTFCPSTIRYPTLSSSHISVDVDISSGTVMAAVAMNTTGDGVYLAIALQNKTGWLSHRLQDLSKFSSVGEVVLRSDGYGSWLIALLVNRVPRVFISDTNLYWKEYEAPTLHTIHLDVAGNGPSQWIVTYLLDDMRNKPFLSNISIWNYGEAGLIDHHTIPGKASDGHERLYLFTNTTVLGYRYGDAPIQHFLTHNNTIYTLSSNLSSITDIGTTRPLSVFQPLPGKYWNVISGLARIGVGMGTLTEPTFNVPYIWMEITAYKGHLKQIVYDGFKSILMVYTKYLAARTYIHAAIGIVDEPISDIFLLERVKLFNATVASGGEFCIQNPIYDFPDSVNTTAPVVDVTKDGILKYCEYKEINGVCTLEDNDGVITIYSEDTGVVTYINSSIVLSNTTLVLQTSNIEIADNFTVNNDASVRVEQLGDGVVIGGCFNASGTLEITTSATEDIHDGDEVTIFSYGCLEGEGFSREDISLPDGMCSDVEYQQTALQIVFTTCGTDETFSIVIMSVVLVCSVLSFAAIVLGIKVFWRRIFPYREENDENLL